MTVNTDFIPEFRERNPPKLATKKWLTPDEPQVILFQGMRGSGKGVSVDNTAERLYKEGITILHLWGARSYENLFWTINLNCKEKYENIKRILQYYFGNKSNKTETERSFVKSIQEKYIPIMEDEKLIQVFDDKPPCDKIRVSKMEWYRNR